MLKMSVLFARREGRVQAGAALVDRLGIPDEDALEVYRECEKDFSKAYATLEREYAELLEF